MCEYFLLKLKLKFKYAEHFYACLCEFFKDRLVYSCSGCYKISQFVFSTYYSRMYLKSALSLV